MLDPRVKAYGIAGSVFALDRGTKLLVEKNVGLTDTYHVIPGFFDIVHSQNRGAVFGMFHNSTSEWRTVILILVSVLALGIVAGMLWAAPRLDRLTFWGLSVVLGGAMGNVFDRIAWGRVTDFLEFYVGNLHWPTFNVADIAIVVGSGLLLLEMLRPKRPAART